MLVLTCIPFAPRIARADGPIIDNDVLRVMDEKPDEEHALIVSVELCRTPLNLEELLPTPEETNECTRLWRAWETLAEEFEEGCNEQLTQAHVDAAYAEAKTYDEWIVSYQKAAYRAYQEDYAKIVEESVPDVYESLRSVLGDKVRRVGDSSKLLAVRANCGAFETIRETASLKRVSFDLPMGPMLDKSRRNILADLVHCPPNPLTPYTGAGVKLAIVDDGAQLHDRLPPASERIQKDFTTDRSECESPDNNCTPSHSTRVTGVALCHPNVSDPCLGGFGFDEFVGIAYGATLINAKVAFKPELNCGYPPTCGPLDYLPETWATDLSAFEWAVVTPQSQGGAKAHLINFSRGYVEYGIPDEDHDTLASDNSSLNVDWIVVASGACFFHSCGNLGVGDPPVSEISPPSGAYNCISVGGYDDKNLSAVYRDQAVIWDGTAQGPTDDGRKKPDLCGPAVGIISTKWTEGFVDTVAGTSFAAPHVAGACALLLEARPSLGSRQIHAILVNATDFALLPPSPGTNRQSGWDDQGGYGMLNAGRAIDQRNMTLDDQLSPGAEKTFAINRPDAGDLVVITCVWQRSMVDEDSPVTDSPGNLDLFLERRPTLGGIWHSAGSSSESAVDNLEQVRGAQPGSGTQYDFRVRVKRVDLSPALLTQPFSLASRHAFN